MGGNSDVGKSLARDFSKLGAHLILTSRKKDQLNSFRSDLSIRYGIRCEVEYLDVLDFGSHDSFYHNLTHKPDIVISCIGYLDNQSISEQDFEEARKSIDTNFTGLVSLLNLVSIDFERRKAGIIVGISSVAGDRGRGMNYIYGSSKSAFTSYLSGLRTRLYRSGVSVITIKPGFIHTKMTHHLKLNPWLTSSAQEVSREIIQSIKKDKSVVYIKWYWKWIMLVIRLIPERLFKRMSF